MLRHDSRTTGTYTVGILQPLMQTYLATACPNVIQDSRKEFHAGRPDEGITAQRWLFALASNTTTHCVVSHQLADHSAFCNWAS